MFLNSCESLKNSGIIRGRDGTLQEKWQECKSRPRGRNPLRNYTAETTPERGSHGRLRTTLR
jgi:hypothetical protein